MGLFDAWKKRRQKKKRSVIKTEKEDKTDVGKKVATTAMTAIEKRRAAEKELLEGL